MYNITLERSGLTIEKYLRDVRAIYTFLDGRELNRHIVLEYKQRLTERYKPASVNSMLAAINSFFNNCGWTRLRVKPLKIQKRMFSEPEKELSQEEYRRLLSAAKLKKNERCYAASAYLCLALLKRNIIHILCQNAFLQTWYV